MSFWEVHSRREQGAGGGPDYNEAVGVVLRWGAGGSPDYNEAVGVVLRWGVGESPYYNEAVGVNRDPQGPTAEE